MASEEDSKGEPTLTKKINGLIERFSWFIVTIIITILGGLYTTTIERISNTEEKVSFLMQDKVSRAELREVATDLRIQSDKNKSEILQQQSDMKGDILARLDLILKIYPPTSPNYKRQRKEEP